MYLVESVEFANGLHMVGELVPIWAGTAQATAPQQSSSQGEVVTSSLTIEGEIGFCL